MFNFKKVVVCIEILILNFLCSSSPFYQKSSPICKDSKNDISFAKLRNFSHVESFYNELSGVAIEIAMKNNIPPAALLAISGLESGYGSGYVYRITGNILSLGARKGDKELPPLKLPHLKVNKEIVLDRKKLRHISGDDIFYVNHKPSLKKDFRPLSIAGQRTNLDYFLHNSKQKKKAVISCLEEFSTRWISKNSKVPAFREARIILDKLVKDKGKKVLLEEGTSKLFISLIGGRNHSFNHRASWVRKISYIIDNAALVELSKDLYLYNLDFNDSWQRFKFAKD